MVFALSEVSEEYRGDVGHQGCLDRKTALNSHENWIKDGEHSTYDRTTLTDGTTNRGRSIVRICVED